MTAADDGLDDEAAALLDQHAGGDRPPLRSLLAGCVSGAWLDGQRFDPLAWHLPGVIPEGATLLVGPPKAGKSWLVLGLALGVAAGGQALGVAVEQRPVLYLALEDSLRRLQTRCRTLSMGEPLPAQLSLMTTLAVPGTLLETVGAWMEAVRDHGPPPLVILDTLGKVKPQLRAGESAYGQDYRVAGQLKRLADEVPGSALVIVHHTRKAASEDFVDSASGTHGVAGACDTIVALQRARHDETAVLHVTGRDVDEVELSIDRSGAAWMLTGGSMEAAARAAHVDRTTDVHGERTRQLVGMVASREDPWSPSELVEALGGDPWDSATVSVYLKRAVERGQLAKPGRGRYALPLGATYTPVSSVGCVSSTEGETNTTQSETNTPDGAVGYETPGQRAELTLLTPVPPDAPAGIVGAAFPGAVEVPPDWDGP